MKKFILLAMIGFTSGLFCFSAYSDERNFPEGPQGPQGPKGHMGNPGLNGSNGSDGDSYGAGFGLINPAYNYKETRWQGFGGASQFDGTTSGVVGVGKSLPHNAFINLNVGTSDGKQGVGGALNWVFK